MSLLEPSIQPLASGKCLLFNLKANCVHVAWQLYSFTNSPQGYINLQFPASHRSLGCPDGLQNIRQVPFIDVIMLIGPDMQEVPGFPGTLVANMHSRIWKINTNNSKIWHISFLQWLEESKAWEKLKFNFENEKQVALLCIVRHEHRSPQLGRPVGFGGNTHTYECAHHLNMLYQHSGLQV